eukprot:TRINITY_DN10379_c0_g1_i2.p6 TRINITY_DN10379_c0_g1~~TRINITY_DN10379_c0_g1_i2.p6  ORF type:complete len:108 (+),score=5.42 TRINITY_DN10379_c0_g1_i2:117-440(+)
MNFYQSQVYFGNFVKDKTCHKRQTKFWKMVRSFQKFGKLGIGPTPVKLLFFVLQFILTTFLGICRCSCNVTTNFGEDVFLCRKSPPPPPPGKTSKFFEKSQIELLGV